MIEGAEFLKVENAALKLVLKAGAVKEHFRGIANDEVVEIVSLFDSSYGRHLMAARIGVGTVRGFLVALEELEQALNVARIECIKE